MIVTDRVPKPHAGFVFGPFQLIRPGYENDAGLIAHEEEHCEWWMTNFVVSIAASGVLSLVDFHIAALIAVFWSLFGITVMLKFRWFRLWYEVTAYRIQRFHYEDNRDHIFATFLCERYNLSLAYSDAVALVNGSKGVRECL